jgi:copper(I)-binding protein
LLSGGGSWRRFPATTGLVGAVRLPWPAVLGGVVVAALGVAGMVRGAMPQSAAGGPTQSAAGPIVVTNAYIRPPVPPNTTAAAYFTVYNTTAQADRLLAVQSGAGATAVLHTIGHGGEMSADADGVVIPAHGTVTLSPGRGHVMIGQLFGRLKRGQTVDLELDFQNAGPIDVVARVIPFGAAAPSSRPSGAHS